MGGGFRKEVGAVGPIVAGLSGAVLVGGILIYMGLCSSTGRGVRDNNDYKHGNDDDNYDDRYDSRGTFPGRVIIEPNAKRWNEGSGGGSNNHYNRNDHNNNNNNDDDDDSTVQTENRSTREIMESSSPLLLSLSLSLSLSLLSYHLISK